VRSVHWDKGASIKERMRIVPVRCGLNYLAFRQLVQGLLLRVNNRDMELIGFAHQARVLLLQDRSSHVALLRLFIQPRIFSL
jgi:hypothetical protein